MSIEPPPDQLAALDIKGFIAAYGPAIGTVTGIGGLLLGVFNWFRTGRLNRRAHANNRASRFEAAYAPALNETLVKLKELIRTIAQQRNSLTSVDEAKTFARERLQPQVAAIENIFTNEVALVAKSDLSADKSRWKAAVDPRRWDAASGHVASIFTATSIDTIPTAMTGLSHVLVEAMGLIQAARDNENSIR